ncbi:MAG: ABC transporter ATP-binding protein [Candidatus Omnitrophica bacterium]|nr:ABC transporter ATP-binding protein [Candidatus Omnitrophota bacterium]
MRGPGGHFSRFDKRIIPEDDKPGAKLNLVRLFGYLKPYRWQVAFTLFISVAVTLLSLIPPRLIGVVIDQALGKKDLPRLYFISFSLLLVYITSHALGGLKNFLMSRLGLRVIYDLWQDVYQNLLRLSFNFYDDNQTGNIMSRITNDVSAVERVIVDGVDTIIVASLTLLGVTFVLFRINWKLALITMIPIPILLFLALFVTRRAHRIYRQVRRKMGEISALLQDNISGIRETKSFGREDYEVGRFSEKSTDYMGVNLQAVKLWSIFSPAILTTTSIGTVLVLLFGGQLVISAGKLSAGEIVSFLFYLGLFYQPIHQLNMVNHMLQHGRAASERIFEVIDTEPQIREAGNAVNLPQPVKGGVIFQDVHFSYKPGKEILRGVSFEAKPGEIVALVGATGAGKTTTVNLIPRFYEVENGAIFIDGINVRELKVRNLRENIGIVMQEPFLFDGSIIENIAYGRLDATLDEIVAISKLANAHNFIVELADGYEHQIGERGVRLSVGEKQRIAIARALLKNPPILILDEATSSVDNKTEALIQEAIEHLLRNRTSFVIAHRLSTVMHANKILVFQAGKIVESGNHEELLARGGVYYDLYQIQWRYAKQEPNLFRNSA